MHDLVIRGGTIVDGYVCTIKSGQVAFRNDEYLGVHPGGLIRRPQHVQKAIAAE